MRTLSQPSAGPMLTSRGLRQVLRMSYSAPRGEAIHHQRHTPPISLNTQRVGLR